MIPNASTAHFIEELDEPIERATGIGEDTIMLTHRAYGWTFQPWNDTQITAYSVLGTVDGDDNFSPYPGTDEIFPIDNTGEHADFDTLLAEDVETSKAEGTFEVQNVIDIFKVVRARLSA